jgi:carboxypeptidase Taq
MFPNQEYQLISEHFNEIGHLKHLITLATWDNQILAPQNGQSARNNAISYASKLSHNLLLDPKLSHLIDKIDIETLNSWQKRNLELIKKEVFLSRVLPENLVQSFTQHKLESEQAWRKCRALNDWKSFIPFLKNTVKDIKEIAKIKGDYLNKTPYDSLLDQYSPGLSELEIDPIFNKIKSILPNFISEVREKQSLTNFIPIDSGNYDIEKQKMCVNEIAAILGFNFDSGRIDTSHHPFSKSIGKGDVRITTRYDETNVLSAILLACHEIGHAFYEQSLPTQDSLQPISRPLGMSVHESQALLYENHICASKPFIDIISRILIKHFGHSEKFEVNNLYLNIRFVQPQLIRLGSDEVTYPMHIILRYEIEKLLIGNDIQVEDLPTIWQEKMKKYLELEVEGNYKDGVMQDIHWPAGGFGYFPAYLVGSIMAAQLYSTASEKHQTIIQNIEKSDFSLINNWLQQNIHKNGSIYSFHDLLQLSTNKTLTVEPFLAHLSKRYL